MKTHSLIVALAFAILPPAMAAPETSAARDARMGWWREARFGMFVHWGLYSGLAGNWDGKMVADKGGLERIQKIVGADSCEKGNSAGGWKCSRLDGWPGGNKDPVPSRTS